MKQLAFLAIIVVFFSACGESIPVNEISDIVVEIQSGNTIMLANGLTVQLKGIRNTPETANWLKTFLLNKTVSLTVDADDEQHLSDYNTVVSAYLDERKAGAVNGYLLRMCFAKFSNINCVDSLNAFKTIRCSDVESKPTLPFSELFVKYAPAVFTIITDSGKGTGFFISPDGYAISNAHVFNPQKNDEKEVKVYLWDSEGKTAEHRYRTIHRVLDWKFSGNLGGEDWIIFHVQSEQNEKFPYFDINKGNLLHGMELAAFGTPLGKYGTLTAGIINNLESNLITISADLNYGNSGGPVIDKKGNVIGISTWVDSKDISGGIDASKRNYAQPMTKVTNVLDKMGDVWYGGK